MKWIIPLFALVTLPAAAAGAQSRARVEAYIRASEETWAHVAVTGDPAPTAAFLAEDYEGVSSRSEVRSRAQMLERFTPDPALVSDTVDYVRLRFPTPDLAIAQGGETALFKDGSRKSLIWTDVWLRRGGRWRIVTSQDSRLPQPYRPMP